MRGVVDLKTHLRRARKKRWEGKSTEEKVATTSHAGKAAWAGMTPEERSEEMKRRAEVRKANQTTGPKPKGKRKK